MLVLIKNKQLKYRITDRKVAKITKAAFECLKVTLPP